MFNLIKKRINTNANMLLLIEKTLNYEYRYTPLSRFAHYSAGKNIPVPNILNTKSGNRALGFSSLVMRHRNTKAEVSSDEIDPDKPIQFSTSKAANVQSEKIFISKNDRPWFEYYVMYFSIAILLVYFTMLREENDVDLKLQRTPASYLGMLEEEMQDAYDKLKASGKDTTNIEVALDDIRMQKSRFKG